MTIHEIAPEVDALLAAPPSPNGMRPTQELDAFLAEPEPEYDWLVPGLLERRDRVITTAREGKGKSTLLRQIGVQVASGIHPFTLDPIAPCRVLLVDCENGRAHVRRHLRPLRAEAGDRYVPENFRLLVEPGGLDLLTVNDRKLLDATVADAAPDLLIIGPIYKLATGDPIKEEPARIAAKALDDLRSKHGVTLLIEAHTPYTQPNTKPIIRPYGASLWSRWPEFGIFLHDNGKLEHWRGPRDERSWPAHLRRSEPWPWEPSPDAPASPDGAWRPTILMERASRALADLNADGVYPSKTALQERTKGKKQHALSAIDFLISDGFADLDPTGRRLVHVRAYTAEPET